MKKREVPKVRRWLIIEPKLDEQIEAYALKEGRSVNNALTKIISEFLAEEKEKTE